MRRRPLPTQLTTALTLVAALATLAPAIGCDRGGCPCCDLPRGVHDWIIEIDAAPVPDPITGFPVFVDVSVEVRSLENGSPAPDGLVVTLTVSPGSFVGGGTQVERSLVDGGASATIRADAAGSYRLSVTEEGEGRTAWIVIDVGP
ncbi:MAG: hypothetical protein AB1Z65_04865 [Candidatus Sulfomarinibacteraceae bacterium]